MTVTTDVRADDAVAGDAQSGDAKATPDKKTKEARYVVGLEVTGSQGKKSLARFREGSYELGRAEGCAVRFRSHARGISQHHARLTVTRKRARLEDLESETGTMVNGRVIRDRVLEDGDVIAIGKIAMRVALAERPADGKPRDGAGVVLSPSGVDGAVPAAKELSEELRLLAGATSRLTAEIGKRILGQRDVVRLVWATMLARGHCLLVGVPGLAKTYLVNTLAEVLGLQFKRIQFTPDLMPADIVGSNVIHEGDDGRRHFEFVQGPVFTQLLLADEINRTPPKTQAALLEAMQERQVTVGEKSLSLPDPFCVIATQNPIEQEGTYPLPEAQLDRFMLCVTLDYPEDDDEVNILLETTGGTTPDVDRVVDYDTILRFQTTVNRVAATREVAEFAAAIVKRTRPRRSDAPEWLSRVVDWGAGPRAGQSLIRAAKALAAMDGRPAISVDDVADIALPVLRHRISCNYRARADSLDEDSVVRRVLGEVSRR